VRPDRDSDIGTNRVAAPASAVAFGPILVSRSRPRLAAHLALWRHLVTYVDRELTCVDCGSTFIHSADDQQYYAEKGFASDPKRCVSCRASRRATRDGGYTASDLGGPRGYERSSPTREYFAVLCSECGNQAQVPFKPRMDRPVYCSDCFRKIHPD
jgi:CxxC-x17-CxxC domain-containing protein